MFNVRKLYAFAVMLFLGGSLIYAEKAPEFTIYQYKDQTFSTDTVFGEKIAVFIFGSIT